MATIEAVESADQDRWKQKYSVPMRRREAARAYDAEEARVRTRTELSEEWKDVKDIEEKYEALSYKSRRREPPLLQVSR